MMRRHPCRLEDNFAMLSVANNDDDAMMMMMMMMMRTL